MPLLSSKYDIALHLVGPVMPGVSLPAELTRRTCWPRVPCSPNVCASRASGARLATRRARAAAVLPSPARHARHAPGRKCGVAAAV